MSFLHRIGSTESSERIHGSPGVARRKMSFNPVEAPGRQHVQREPIGAYEVSKPKRIAQVVASTLYCLFGAGIIFGYAAIKQVFIQEGVYRERCTKQELDDNVEVCYDQEFRLNLMFTIGAVVINVSALPVGTILDRYGPRLCGIAGGAFIAIGCLCLAFAEDVQVDGYIPGYVFLALGGPFIFISSFQLSNTFPRYSGLILALLTGAFDTSSVMFLFYRLLYRAFDGQLPPKRFFLIYLLVPVYIILVQIFLMPKNSYKTVGELLQLAKDESVDEHDTEHNATNSRQTITHDRSDHGKRRESVLSEITNLLGSHDASTQTEAEERKQAKSGVWGALHGETALQQIRTPWWILITLLSIIQMLRINYFIATVRPQYIWLTDPTAASRINDAFDIALPVGGIVAIPIVGAILDNTSTAFALATLVSLATAIGVLGVIPNEGAGYANVLLFVIFRPLYYTTISDYSAKVFGFATFGKVYGLIFCLAGLCNFFQAALDALTHDVFDANPILVNIILLCIGLAVGIALVSYVWLRSRSIKREMLEREALEARPLIMPGADSRVYEDRHTVDVHGYGTRDATDWVERERRAKTATRGSAPVAARIGGEVRHARAGR